ncbi:type I secretion membrane fusion protein, HlyD family [Rhodovulum sp. PH10]|uniref:HlyD family type I secretion periplasmic adaptor subunit n=1 Tax=Rhodovulum sp. PH10 TaxID=1187851 RepID=UPI00027C1EE9|nr:HlyD family type I secretion periplasmic adaptor subunit [Rhodovulum sp. PH10]EJW09723.1 type I secretion membrane fusion protein, HlyD family [Rhodovulum sp. PH10]
MTAATEKTGKALGVIGRKTIIDPQRAAGLPEARTVAPLDFTDRSVPPELHARVQRPILLGVLVTLFFVVGGFVWACFAPLAGAVVAQGFVRVEDNRKTIKHRDGGIVRDILVEEGQEVSAGQTLMLLDDVIPRANVDVLRAGYRSALVQRARLEAERDDAASMSLPPELAEQANEPAVQALLRDQENLFASRQAALEGQLDVLSKRKEQLATRVKGLEAQLAATEEQAKFVDDELQGVLQLFDQGLVPKTRARALQRTAADLAGNKGATVAEIARTQQQMGETELQIVQLRQQRAAEVADGLRDVQNRISDALPRLRAAEETLAQTRVLAPVTGYVLNLTQFTRGGVVGAGERLLDIVPTDTPLVLEARVKPDEAYEVAPGMDANVKLSTYEARRLPMIPARVTKVSADRLQDQRTGEPYFTTELAIAPDTLRDLGQQVRVYPGMSATVMIGTGERTVMDYLMAPVRDSLRSALKER